MLIYFKIINYVRRYCNLFLINIFSGTSFEATVILITFENFEHKLFMIIGLTTINQHVPTENWIR